MSSKTRKYVITATPVITESDKIEFRNPEVVPVSRIKTGVSYIADDDAKLYTFESSQPYGKEYEYALCKSWKFAKRQMIRLSEVDGNVVETVRTFSMG